MVLTHSVTGTAVPCIRAKRAIAGLGNPGVTNACPQKPKY